MFHKRAALGRAFLRWLPPPQIVKTKPTVGVRAAHYRSLTVTARTARRIRKNEANGRRLGRRTTAPLRSRLGPRRIAKTKPTAGVWGGALPLPYGHGSDRSKSVKTKPQGRAAGIGKNEASLAGRTYDLSHKSLTYEVQKTLPRRWKLLVGVGISFELTWGCNG